MREIFDKIKQSILSEPLPQGESTKKKPAAPKVEDKFAKIKAFLLGGQDSIPEGTAVSAKQGLTVDPRTKQSFGDEDSVITTEGTGEDSVATTYHGPKAIAKVEEQEGELTPAQKRVVELEGFVQGTYLDTKGIETAGVGQTGEWIGKSFKEAFSHHEDLTKKYINDYDQLPEYLKAELMQATYRGDLGGSPRFRRLMNRGKYDEAADEFLDNAEYKDPNTPKSIKRRMEAVADAVARYASESEKANMNTASKLEPGVYYDDKNQQSFVVHPDGKREVV